MTAPFRTPLLNDPPTVSVSSSPQYQNYVPAALAMLSLVEKVRRSLTSRSPTSLSSFLSTTPTWREKKKTLQHPLFFSSPPSPLYPTLPLFFFVSAFSFFFLVLVLLYSLTLLGEFGSEIALFVVVESWLGI